MLQISLTDLPADFRARALQWAAQFAHCAYYEHNDLQQSAASTFSRRLAVATTTPEAPGSLAELAASLTEPGAALPYCGFVTYDVKNEVEALNSDNFSGFNWPALHFFRPETCLLWRADTLEIQGVTTGVLTAILATEVPVALPPTVPPLRPRMPRAAYLQAVENVREDILNGEVYELNLCQEFYAEAVRLDPVATFWQLNELRPRPTQAFCATTTIIYFAPHPSALSRASKAVSRRSPSRARGGAALPRPKMSGSA
jgi:para-aminobenzoate synthetase component 1